MALLNNFNDVRIYIDNSIKNLQLPDHYKDQITTYTKTLVPTNQTRIGTASKILKIFATGDTWLVGDTKTVYTYNGTTWVAGQPFTPWNGDYYFVLYYLEADNVQATIQVQANVTYNGNSKLWDVAKDLYFQPDGVFLVTDSITGNMTTSTRLQSYHDALNVLGVANTVNFIVQKTNGSVGVEKKTITGNGFVVSNNGNLTVDTTKYISTIGITGGTSTPGQYVSALSVAGNNITVTKTNLPNPPTLNDLNGQLKNDLLTSLSSLNGANGFLNIEYDSAGATPETKWKLTINNNLVTNSSLTTTLANYQPKANILTKLTNIEGLMSNGNDYVINLHQNSSTVGDYTASVEHRANLINFGTDSGTSGAGKFLSNLTKDANGNLIRTFANALTNIGLSGNTVETGKAIVSATVSGSTITFVKDSFIQTLVKGTTTGSGNVITDVTISGNTITPVKGITALTAITKAMVEAVLTGTITSHNHSGVYDPAGSANTSLVNAKSYTDTQIASKLTDLLTSGTTNYNALIDIITDKVNEMIRNAQFPDSGL